MRVVVSIGGSVLVPSVEADRVAAYAAVLSGLADSGHELGVVVGGGPTAREYIDTARELGGDEVTLDRLGIGVTRLNARLLIAALDGLTVLHPVTTTEEGGEALRNGKIPVMGGTAPGHTTDTVATALAEHADADLLVYATSVEGVFDTDPHEAGGATKFDRLSPAELVEVIVDIELSAGSNAPVDLLAAKLIERSGLRAVVLDGSDPSRVADAVDGTHSGTDIVPDNE